MAKGPRKARNPVEKLQSHVAQMDNIVQAILDSADKPEFASSIVALRQKREEEESGKTKLNKDAREVSKLLKLYPGLSKQVLVSLRSKISEYKTLNVLEKYKTEIEPQPRKKKAAAANNSGESASKE